MNQSRTLQQETTDKDLAPKEENVEIFVWGSNHHGQLGLGDTYVGKTYSTPRPLAFNFVIQEVSCGEDHAAFVTSRGQIYTMGSNIEGRLGIGNKNIERSSAPLLVEACSASRCTQISCGWAHTLAVMDSGDVMAWGAGESGALGTGTTESIWSPVRISLEEKVFLAAKKVSAGSTHSAFISELGTLYVCGAGDAGQLGTGRRDKELRPVQMTLISEKARDVACGVFHTLILTERSKVYATGGNIFGQLGLGNKKSTNIPIRIKDLDYARITKVACGHHSAALTETGEIYVWGTGVFGEFVSPVKFSQSGQTFKDITLNGFFGAAIDQEGHIWSWGSNNNGELGQGHYEPKTKPYINELLLDKKMEKLACGVSFVVALKEGNGLRRRPTPLRHRRDSAQQLQFDSNQTPKRMEIQTPSQETMLESKQIGVNDIKARMANRMALRTSSAGKAREGLESTNSRKASSRTRGGTEVPGFIDLLGREKSSGDDKDNTKKEKEKEKGEIDNITVIEKLLKQKEVLEKALAQEKAEKVELEQNLKELNLRLEEFKEGPDGLIGMSETFNRQTRKLDELRSYYEEEAKRREKILQELQLEQQTNKELTKRITERDETISRLQARVEQGEVFKKRAAELEGTKQRLAQQIEAIERQNQETLGEFNRIKTRMLDAEKNLNQKTDSLKRLEEQRQLDLNEKQGFKEEIGALNLTVQDLTGRLERSLKGLERETEAKRLLEEELRHSKQKEQEEREQIKLLMAQIDNMKETYERKLDEEQQSKAKLQEENTIFEQEIQGLREEVALLNEDKADLEDELVESQQKNRRLLELLNQEIDKQNQALQHKGSNSLSKPGNLGSHRSNKHREDALAHDLLQRGEEQRPLALNRLDRSRGIPYEDIVGKMVIEDKKTPFARAENGPEVPAREERDYLYRSVERSHYTQQKESMEKSPGFEDLGTEAIVFESQYGSFGSPQKDQTLTTETVKEERARKLTESGKRRHSTQNEDHFQNPDQYDVYRHTDQSRCYSPGKDRSIRENESYSGSKRRSLSPSKNFSTIESKESEQASDGNNYFDDLKEVQEKMEELERNKKELQTKLIEFETKLNEEY